MKIYHLVQTYAVAAFLAINVTGCGEKHTHAKEAAPHQTNESHESHEGHSEEEHTEASHGVGFKEGKGLHLPDSASEMLGVKTVEVTEGQVEGGVDLSLRIFANGSKPEFLYATGSVSTNDASLLRPGLAVSVQQSRDKPALSGTISSIEKTGAMGLADVVVELPKSLGLQVGSFVDAIAKVKSEEAVALVPKAALLETSEGQFVYVVNGDHLFRTAVVTGTKGADSVEIKDGLYAGDQVVLQPVMPLWLAELQAIRGGKACADGH